MTKIKNLEYKYQKSLLNMKKCQHKLISYKVKLKDYNQKEINKMNNLLI